MMTFHGAPRAVPTPTEQPGTLKMPKIGPHPQVERSTSCPSVDSDLEPPDHGHPEDCNNERQADPVGFDTSARELSSGASSLLDTLVILNPVIPSVRT